MRERGEYRPIYQAILDGQDYQRLTPHGRLLLFVVKVSLGGAGIRAIPGAVGVFSEWTGLSEDQVAGARDELIETDWLDVERNVWWLRRGLLFEPSMSSGDEKHRKFVQRVIAGLPSLGIRQRFQDAYTQWFTASPAQIENGPSKAPAKALHKPHRKPYRKGLEKGLASTTTSTSTSTSTSPETPQPPIPYRDRVELSEGLRAPPEPTPEETEDLNRRRAEFKAQLRGEPA